MPQPAGAWRLGLFSWDFPAATPIARWRLKPASVLGSLPRGAGRGTSPSGKSRPLLDVALAPPKGHPAFLSPERTLDVLLFPRGLGPFSRSSLHGPSAPPPWGCHLCHGACVFCTVISFSLSHLVQAWPGLLQFTRNWAGAPLGHTPAQTGASSEGVQLQPCRPLSPSWRWRSLGASYPAGPHVPTALDMHRDLQGQASTP